MSYFHISSQSPTITDWIQTGVYMLTGFALFVNFWYQRKNLQEQNRLRFIEEERDRRAIMPRFEFEKEFDAEHDIHKLIFTIKENPCKYLMISSLTKDLQPYFLINAGLKVGECVTISIPESILKRERNNKNNDPIFKVDFMDRDVRPYVQSLYMVGFLIYISDPIEYQYIKKAEEQKQKYRFGIFHRKKKRL